MSDPRSYVAIEELPGTVPLFPLAGALMLPRGRLPLNIFEPRYIQMIDDCLTSRHRMIGMVQPGHSDEEAGHPSLQEVACVGRLSGFQEAEDDRYLITLTGVCRCKITSELDAMTPYRQARVDYTDFAADLAPAEDGDKINRPRLLELLREYLDTNNMDADWKMINSTGGEELVNFLSMISPFGPLEKQALLEAKTCVERTDILIALVEMVLAKPDPSADAPLH